MPPRLEVSVSNDGTTFTSVAILTHPSPEKQPRPYAETLTAALTGVQARYIRITAANPGPAPAWHKRATQPTWLYMDEITIE